MTTITANPSAVAEARESALESLGVAEAVNVHKHFFRAAIAIILTLGAVWGAYLLLRIGFAGSFTSVGIHEVNAHGHAQIFGWVGLFVMGFAYQMFPRFKQTALLRPGVVKVSLLLMIVGILLRSILEPFARSVPWTVWPALAGNGLEIIAIGLFLREMVGLMRRSLQPLNASDIIILSALGWFAIQALYETAYFAATAWAPDRDSLLALVATWQAPLRDVQIHGFAMLMIFGVSLRILPMFFGWREVGKRTGLILAVVLNAAIILEAAGFLMMRMVGHEWAAMWAVAALALLVGTTWHVMALRVLRSPAKANRSVKYVRAAHVWLLVSMAMLLLLPVWQFVALPALAPGSAAVEMGFSHAYYGAIRHAITVGFISLMIMGIGAFVAAESAPAGMKLSGLWLPFILVNVGCFMRVFFQMVTDVTPLAFPFAGVSGVLEVAGLVLWSWHMLWLMWQ